MSRRAFPTVLFAFLALANPVDAQKGGQPKASQSPKAESGNGNGKRAAEGAKAQAAGAAEKAENGAKAEKDKKIPRDPDALAFLKSVIESDKGWDADFPGFSSKIEVYWKGAVHVGTVTVRDRNKTEIDLPDEDAKKWASVVVADIVSYGYRGDFDKEYANLGVTFGRDDLNPLGQLLEVHGGKTHVRYRIKDGQIRRVNRANGDKRVTIDVLQLRRDDRGRKVSQIYAVQYFDLKREALTRSETVDEGKVEVGGYMLPAYHDEIVSEGLGPSTRAIRFHDHKLLERSVKSSQ